MTTKRNAGITSASTTLTAPMAIICLARSRRFFPSFDARSLIARYVNNHKDTKTQRPRAHEEYSLMRALGLCVLVSLWLLTSFTVARKRKAHSEMVSPRHRPVVADPPSNRHFQPAPRHIVFRLRRK